MNQFVPLRAQKRPFHVMVKPNGPICNLDCAYCYYLSKEQMFPENEVFRMSDEVLHSFTRQMIESQPGPVVNFAWQGGEPTLLGIPFFKRAVELQEKYLPKGWRSTNAFQTNGTLLNPEWCEFLRENDFLIGISIDGPAHIHDYYRKDKGGRATHHNVLRGLTLLQEHGVEHNVLCVVNAHNAKHPLDVYHFFKEQGVEFLQFIPIVERVGEEEVSDRSVGAEEYGDFLIAIFEEWVRHDVGRVYVQIFDECLAVWAGYPPNLCVFQETCGYAMAMEHNGDLFACDHFVTPEYRLGNMTEQPLASFIDLPEQNRFGQDKKESLPRQCRTCEVRFMCNGGCPKDRFIKTRDGEDRLNYLCRGFRKFFNHVDLPMRTMAGLLKRRSPPANIMEIMRREDERKWSQVGRNDLCPCGSGKKFKHCCSTGRVLPHG